MAQCCWLSPEMVARESILPHEFGEYQRTQCGFIAWALNAPNVTCLQGMKIPAPEAAKFGLILEAVPDDALESRAIELARRIARVPSNQLYMLKLSCNQTAENMGLGSACSADHNF